MGARDQISKDTSSAWLGSPAIVSTTVYDKCRCVYIGAADNYDFSFDSSTWVTFNGATAGYILPIQVTGARHSADETAPDAGDIVFLY